VYGAVTLAVADLNSDGWSDIVTLNAKRWLPSQQEGEIIRVFWGGENGFFKTRATDIGLPGTIDLAGGDFDNDGFRDIAALKSEGTLTFLWSGDSNEIEDRSDLVLASDSQPDGVTRISWTL